MNKYKIILERGSYHVDGTELLFQDDCAIIMDGCNGISAIVYCGSVIKIGGGDE